MPHCDHTCWFQLVATDKSVSLSYTQRFSRLLDELPDPIHQTPTLLYFIGKKAKNEALAFIFPGNGLSNRGAGLCRIRSDVNSIQSESPIFIADGGLNCRVTKPTSLCTCYHNTSYPLFWQPESKISVIDILTTRLILPFCTAIIWFIDDFGGAQTFRRHLERWTRIKANTGIKLELRPRLILVSSRPTVSPTDLRCLCATIYQSELFSSITTISSSGHKGKTPFLGQLKEKIFQEIEDMRTRLSEHHLRFSAVHLAALIEARMQQITKHNDASLDIIGIARRGYDLQFFREHVVNFLNITQRHQVPFRDVAAFLSTALLLDAYPPGCHSFLPLDMLESVYQDDLQSALREVYGFEGWAQKYKALQAEIIQDFQALKFSSAADLHCTRIDSQDRWVTIKSNKTCMFCIMRSPQHVLSCAHALCEVCVRVLGTTGLNIESSYTIAGCIFCKGRGSLTTVLKPPTCGSRLLSIDGGGTRSIIPLETLKLFQEILGSGLTLQDFFDLSIGTSGGGKIVLSLNLKGWSPARASTEFTDRVGNFFNQNKRAPGILGSCKSYLRYWVQDGIYPSQATDSFIQNIFGTSDRLFGWSPDRFKAKVAVTATSIAESTETVLFSNYNVDRKKALGYDHYKRPDDVQDEVYVWQAARATSAAPIFFPTTATNEGSFQDGGLTHNNPVNLIEYEHQQLWNCPWDIIISLGTGKGQASPKSGSLHYRNFLYNGFLPRLKNWLYWAVTDNDTVHKNFSNRLSDEEKGKYFRFDVELKELPRLDDPSQTDRLRECVHLQPGAMHHREEAMTALLISCFFFELHNAPVFENGLYRCNGSIRCRNVSRAVIRSLTQIHPATIEFSTDQGILGHLNGYEDICRQCHRMRITISFTIRHPSEIISIYLQVRGVKRRISAFPQSMEWFIQKQKLEAKFGRVDHGSPRTIECSQCPWKEGIMHKRKLNLDNMPESKHKRTRF